MKTLNQNIPPLFGMLAQKWYSDIKDKAHSTEHIIDVLNNVDYICRERNSTNIVRQLSLVAALYHDRFTEQREHHHELAFQSLSPGGCYVEEFELLFPELLPYMPVVAYAVGEHRGSYTGIYSTEVSEILAAADRGIPSVEGIDAMLQRSWKYSYTCLGDSKQHSCVAAASRISKICTNIGKVPYWYNTMFKDQLLERANLANDRNKLMEIMDEEWIHKVFTSLDKK